MCGIIGYIGSGEALPVLLEGLKRMEYRGYDSAGVALLSGSRAKVIKRPGKIKNLVEAVTEADSSSTLGIGHTRWATHGQPSIQNAHPHKADNITIVHNGIIENYAQLRDELIIKYKRKFVSETDSEVLAHLIAHERTESKDLADAVLSALSKVKGTFGIAVIDDLVPGQLIAARRGSPLLLGVTDSAIMVASDAAALIGHTERVVYLEDDDIAICERGQYRIMDMAARHHNRKENRLGLKLGAIEKGGHAHFMLKEIMEQPQAVRDVLRGRLDDVAGTSHLGGLNLDPAVYRGTSRILTVACGTAYHSGLLGQYLIERLTAIPVDVEYASEFRYREPVISDGTLGLVITQSGETADTLASLRELKRRGIPTLGLVNAVGSTIAREVDGGVYLHAGPEISVASTKAFTSMVIAQILIGLELGRGSHMTSSEGRELVQALRQLPEQIERMLTQRKNIERIARDFADSSNIMFLGRDLLYPAALEAALKLKEISYIHAEAYPAGEMKHGPVSLIDEDLPIVFLHPQNALYDKTRSNLEEVKARGGRVIIVASEGDESVCEYSDHVITIPKVHPYLEPLLVNIPMQFFAYYMAVLRGSDVDQPRNLAKSVTVE